MCIINFASEITRKQTEIKDYENIALQLKDTRAIPKQLFK